MINDKKTLITDNCLLITDHCLPKALPLGQAMVGFQPEYRAFMKICCPVKYQLPIISFSESATSSRALTDN